MKILANRITRISWSVGIDAEQMIEEGRIDGGNRGIRYETIVLHERVDPEGCEDTVLACVELKSWRPREDAEGGVDCVKTFLYDPKETGAVIHDADDGKRSFAGKGRLGERVLGCGWPERMDEFDDSGLVWTYSQGNGRGCEIQTEDMPRALLRKVKAKPEKALIVVRREGRAEGDWKDAPEYDPEESSCDFPEGIVEEDYDEERTTLLI